MRPQTNEVITTLHRQLFGGTPAELARAQHERDIEAAKKLKRAASLPAPKLGPRIAR